MYYLLELLNLSISFNIISISSNLINLSINSLYLSSSALLILNSSMKECIECSKTKQILKRSNMEPDINRILEESDRQIALDRIRRQKYLERYNKKWNI